MGSTEEGTEDRIGLGLGRERGSEEVVGLICGRAAKKRLASTDSDCSEQRHREI